MNTLGQLYGIKKIDILIPKLLMRNINSTHFKHDVGG